MAIEGSRSERSRAPSATAWSAAGRAPSSAPCTASPRGIDGEFELVAGALSSDPARAKASAAELGLAPDRSYGSLRGDGEGRGQAPRRHRGGRRSSRPTTCTIAAGQGLPRGRHPRHLRQAADLDAGRRQEARRAGREDRQAVRAHPQLHRLSDGAAGPRDGRQGRARRDPRRPGRVSAGLADRAASRRPARSRPPGAPTRSSRAPAARSATSAPMPTTSPASSPASSWTRWRADLSAFVQGPRARRQRQRPAALQGRRPRA